MRPGPHRHPGWEHHAPWHHFWRGGVVEYVDSSQDFDQSQDPDPSQMPDPSQAFLPGPGIVGLYGLCAGDFRRDDPPPRPRGLLMLGRKKKAWKPRRLGSWALKTNTKV